MKRTQLILAAIALPLDYLMLLAAGLFAYRLRFTPLVQGRLPVLFNIPLGDYLSTIALVALGWVALFALMGLYSMRGPLKFSSEVGKLFLASSTGLAFIVLWFFFNPQLFGSRFIVLVGCASAFAATALGRVGLRALRLALYRRGYGVSRVLLLGSSASAEALAGAFARRPELGYAVIGRLANPPLGELGAYLGRIDEVVLGDASLSHQAASQLLEFCHTHHLGFRYVADMFEAQSHNVVTHTVAGVPVIEIRRTALDGWGRIAKRVFDFTVALLLLLVLSPVLLALAAAIAITSGWPPLLGLARVGEAGKPFTLYKFRTMVPGAEQLKPRLMLFNERPDGPLFKMANDPRVTPIGRWLRRTSLDELPQLVNVLRGRMSLVGPRPHEPGEVARYALAQRKLLNIKPGLTGLAQVSGRSNLSFQDEAMLDTFYVENWSLAQDVVILVKTAVVVLQRQAAV